MAKSHLEEPDRGAREAVWQRMMDCFLVQRQTLNELYLEMVPLRRQVARNAGFATYRDYRWQELARFDYSPEDCFTYHDAIEREVVPLARQIYQNRVRKLGIDHMRPWDTDADPFGEPLRPFQDVAELEEGCYRVFQQVDPALAGQFAVMRDGYLDLASRPNKAPGGYCNGFPVSGKPYIFMNAVGTHDNVTTLLHEGGHAFHFIEFAAPAAVMEPKRADGVLRGSVDVDGAAGCALPGAEAWRLLRRGRRAPSVCPRA